MGLFNILKIIFTTFLVSVFFVLFGFPSINHFMSKQTLTVKNFKNFEKSDNPALTICPTKGYKYHGKNFNIFCNNSENMEEVSDCINKNSFNISELVETASDGKGENLMSQEYWVENFSLMSAGKCFTLNTSKVYIGSDMNHPLILNFNTTLSQYTIIHDPNFFILGPNPETMPRILTIQNEDYGTKVLYIKTTQHVKMNLPHKKCEERQVYSLTRCVRKMISKTVGCRAPWDHYSDEDFPVCHEIDQLRLTDKIYQDLSVVEQMEIENQTGCLLPCVYNQYQVVDEPLTISKEKKMINLIRATKTTVIETEVLVYPFSSFLAEFGGALGLFVGFSFMVLWDLMQVAFNIIFMKKHYNFYK